MTLRLAVVAIVALAAAFPAAAAADQQTGIVVTGSGSVTAVPDQAALQLGVEFRASTARAALRGTSKRVRRVVGALAAHGVAGTDIQTAYVSVYREQRKNGRWVYVASSSVSATVRDVATVGAVVDAAVAAGANQVNGPTFGLSDTRALYAQALAAAYDDALAKARALAAKLGVTLGTPVGVVEGPGAVPVAEGAAGGAAQPPVPIEPGTTQVQATVTVTFALP